MLVPVRNLWLLQLFASELYQGSGDEFAGAEVVPEQLPALVAGMLNDEVTSRLHSGLSVGFHLASADLRRLRGRIDVLATERNRLVDRGLVRCRYQDIVTDIPGNRFVRAALDKASSLLSPANPVHTGCRTLMKQMERVGVTGPAPDPSLVRSLQRQRLLARDRRMLFLADLLMRMAIPDPGQNDVVTVAPDDSERYLRYLFERATYGFYRHKLEPLGWQTKHGEHLSWAISGKSEGMQAILPNMQTDIVLVEPLTSSDIARRRIVVDTKFTAVTALGQYGKTTLKSGYLYQIYAYLHSQNDAGPEYRNAEGLMLHPVVEGAVDEDVVIQGHRIRFCTVDLCAPAAEISRQFLRAITRSARSRDASWPGILTTSESARCSRLPAIDARATVRRRDEEIGEQGAT